MYSTARMPVLPARRSAAEGAWRRAKSKRSAIDLEPERRDEMITRTGRRTVPQIFIGDTHVGGFDDLSALDREGKLGRCSLTA